MVSRETPDRRPQLGPCDCNIDHPEAINAGDHHRIAEHTSCWGWPPCGGCHDCLAAQARYYDGLRSTGATGWDIYSTGERGTEVRWRREPAEALAIAFVVGGTIVPVGEPFTGPNDGPVVAGDTCADCHRPILPDEPAGFDFARGRIHAGCLIDVPEVTR